MRASEGSAVTPERPVLATMAIFLVPLMLSNFLQSLGQSAGQIYLGRMVGVRALAVVSSIFPVVFFLVAFLIGIGSGATILIGQAHGAGDLRRVKRVAATTVTLTIALGLVVGGFGVLRCGALLAAIGTPAVLLAPAVSYAHVVFGSMPIVFVYLVYTTFLRGTGDTRTPFYILIASTLVTVAVAPVLIGGWFGAPRLGTNGAAWANVVATAVSLAALLVVLTLRRSPLAPDREFLRDLVPDLEIARRVVRLGVPTGLNLVMVSLAEIAVLSFVTRFGPTAMAAYGAVNQILSYAQFPAVSIGISASVFGAQTIGAGRPERLPAVARAAVTLNYLIEGVIVVAVTLAAPHLVALFTTDRPTQTIALGLLHISLWSTMLFGNARVLSGLMLSSGAVLWPTLIAIGSIWGVEVPAAYVLMRHHGIDGVWAGYPIANVAALAAQYAYYRLVWKRRPIERL